MASPAITAITASLPPETDYLTYLTIVESHLTPEILPTLSELLKDPVLTQNIGWDLIQLLIPLPGAVSCLDTIARLGNPREVVLKVTEALQILGLDEDSDDDEDQDVESPKNSKDQAEAARKDLSSTEHTNVDKFCTLVSLLSILHPRIKTKYPSRFLSTSLIAVLSAYRPSNQATSAIIAFVHALSGKKRPQVPRRTSSYTTSMQSGSTERSAPDPEATEEDPKEEAIQKKLLQSFVTHVLEVYVNLNSLDWSARLQERLEPDKVVTGKKSLCDAFKEDPILHDREMIFGQLVAIARDLGLSQLEVLFEAIYAEPSSTDNDSDDTPSSPDDIPLSSAGSLFLVTYFIFSSKMFDTTDPVPPLSIFSGHTKLVKRFLGINGPDTIGSEELGVIDSLLAIGLWLENTNKFVSGPLENEDYLQHLQTLSLLSANTPLSTLRNSAHVLTSSILHAHPVDTVRLSFIIDTLEHCPYENLRASAVGWLKDELATAEERKSDDLFSTTTAIAAVQPYLFLSTSNLTTASIAEAWEDLRQCFPFHIAVLNFFYFMSGQKYLHTVPPGTLIVAEENYLEPFKAGQARLESALVDGGDLEKNMSSEETQSALLEVRLLGERLSMCMERMASQ